MKKRILSLALALAMVLSLLPISVMAVSINDDEVFVKNGANDTCTLAAATMMLRRKAILNGDANWSAITESAIKSTAWSSAGLRWNFTYAGMDVTEQGLISSGYTTTSAKKEYLISMLSDHPEGIVIYQHSVPNAIVHGVLLTDYDSATDTFYCSDPGSSKKGRIKLTDSTMMAGNSQDEKIGNLKQIWYIKSSGSTSTSTTTPPPLGIEFLPAAQSTWADKEKVTETNAVVVAQIKKNSGVKVSEVGLDLYDANENLIKSYSQKVTTPDTSTSWPCYWDINEEIGVTLTPGTVYTYRFTGIFNKEKKESDLWTFKTKGTAPSTPNTESGPGNLGVKFLPAAQSTWANKEKVTATNAVVVAQTQKNSGVKVTEMGLDLYDASGNLIKSYSQKVTTPDTSTSWPCFWDINEEIGVTLTPGTTYTYRFTGVFNGEKKKSDLWTFRTTGTAPEDSRPGSGQVTYKVFHYQERLDGTYSSIPNITDTYTGAIGGQVTPPVREYHGFDAPEQQTATIPAEITLEISYYYPRAKFRLNVVAGDEGVAQVIGDGLYRYYESAEVGVEVKPGYKFSHWIIEGRRLEVESFSYLIQEDNITVTAYTEKVGPVFSKQPFHTLPYKDVASNAWYYEPVQYMYDNGMMSGTAVDMFSPDTETTQGMMVTMLYRMDGEPEVSSSGMYGNEWYSKASEWGGKIGITGWVSAEVYYPPRVILREEMAIMLYKYAEAKGYDVSERADLSGYEDNKAWGKGYEEMDKAMAWCVAKGIITGTSPTTLSPQSGATRAQIAAILMRFCENVVNKS